jgi:tripartite-type tricarboxylate transporter receptor subunit TctC
MFVPAGTPPAIINQLHREIVAVLKTQDVRQKFFNAGMETVGSSPDELAAAVKSEMNRLGRVIREAGIRAGRN